MQIFLQGYNVILHRKILLIFLFQICQYQAFRFSLILCRRHKAIVRILTIHQWYTA